MTSRPDQSLESNQDFAGSVPTIDPRQVTWGSELAKGAGPGRIYVVEPTGLFMDDPNLTDKKFPGNSTRSYRSREPLRVASEYLDWVGHSPDEIQTMKDAIARKEPIDDCSFQREWRTPDAVSKLIS